MRLFSFRKEKKNKEIHEYFMTKRGKKVNLFLKHLVKSDHKFKRERTAYQKPKFLFGHQTAVRYVNQSTHETIQSYLGLILPSDLFIYFCFLFKSPERNILKL